MSANFYAVHTEKAPKAIGPYVQANVVPAGQQLLHTSGCTGRVPGEKQYCSIDQPDSVEKQARQSLENLKNILEAGNSNLQSVVKTMVYLNSMDDFVRVNKIYEEYFNGEKKPARSCVAVGLNPNCLYEIVAIAIVNK